MNGKHGGYIPELQRWKQQGQKMWVDGSPNARVIWIQAVRLTSRKMGVLESSYRIAH